MSFISKILATSVLYFSLIYVSVDCDQHPVSLLWVIHKDIDVVWCVSYHWCGLMCVVPPMWFDVSYHWCGLMCVIPLMWFDVCCTTDVVWCVSSHGCGLTYVVPLMWFDVCHTTDVVWCHQFLRKVQFCGHSCQISTSSTMYCTWCMFSCCCSEMLKISLSFPLNYCCMLWLTCGAGEWCMHRTTACSEGRLSGGGVSNKQFFM